MPCGLNAVKVIITNKNDYSSLVNKMLSLKTNKLEFVSFAIKKGTILLEDFKHSVAL